MEIGGILELVGGGCLEEGIYHEVKNEFGSSSFALSFLKLANTAHSRAKEIVRCVPLDDTAL